MKPLNKIFLKLQIFPADIPNGKNIYGNNIATKKNDYVVIPETIRKINSFEMMFSFVTYVIHQMPIQDAVSNVTIKLFCLSS